MSFDRDTMILTIENAFVIDLKNPNERNYTSFLNGYVKGVMEKIDFSESPNISVDYDESFNPLGDENIVKYKIKIGG